MQLNEQQKQAVEHLSGPCLVTAIPGSGKTALLVARTVRLIEKGVNSRQILCLTFTNKAANEMKERIASALGVKKVNFFVGTFHSLCVTIIRKFYRQAGYSGSINILDTSDQESLMQQIVGEAGYDVKKDNINVKGILTSYNLSREAKETRTQLGQRFYQAKRQLYLSFIDSYEEECIRQNLIDFSGLLCKALELLENHPAILSSLQNRFRYIQVDEMQDTNYIQYEIIKLLGGSEKNILMVGDANQSIYAFRGARYTNILDFIEENPNCRVINLENNYRSTPEIVKVADVLIRNNTSFMGGEFKTDNPRGRPVKLDSFSTPRVEAENIASKIEYLIEEENWDYEDIAILYRLNKLSMELQMAMSRKGIPFTVIGGPSFFDRREIRDCLSMLRFVANPNDALAFQRIANLLDKVGKVTIGNITSLSKEKEISIIDICRNIEKHSNKKNVISAGNKIAKIFAECESDNPGSLLVNLINQFSYQVKVNTYSKNVDEAEDRWANVEELIRNASESEMSVSKYLQTISLSTSSDKDAGEAVSLMTLHACKGLEFPIVFLVGVEEDILPHKLALLEAETDEKKKEAVEEERRICYVGMTRAKKQLFISYCKSRLERDGRNFNEVSGNPSRFIYEARLLKSKVPANFDDMQNKTRAR